MSSNPSFTIDISEINELQEAIKKLGPEARKEAVKVTSKVGGWMKDEFKSAGVSTGDKLTGLVARQGLRAERRQVFKGKDGVVRASKFSGGYIPTVVIGLDKPLGVKRKKTEKNPAPTSLEVWAGTEFGSNRPFERGGGKRFTRTRNDKGYWFFPTWSKIYNLAEDMWLNMLDKLVRDFTNGG